MTAEERLRDAGYEIKAPAAPVGAYVPAVKHGQMVFTSGQIPLRDGGISDDVIGTVGANVSEDVARRAAAQCVANALAAVKHVIGDLDTVERVIKLTGFVASAPAFIHQSEVINAASDLLVETFGENGRHARSAVGVAALPRGVCVEVELIVAVRDGGIA